MRLLIIFISVWFQCSLTGQAIEPAPSDKAVVYFVRPYRIVEVLKFMIFDGEAVIGRINGQRYLRYECDPGEHLFWARAENRSFVTSNLEAGKIYVIDVLPQVGEYIPRVKLVPINSVDYDMRRIQKLLAKRDSDSFTEKELDKLQKRMSNVIERVIKRYDERGGTSKSLTDFSFSPEELSYKEVEK